MPTIQTDILEIAYETGGPENGLPLILLHGWPDDVRGWRAAAARQHVAAERQAARECR